MNDGLSAYENQYAPLPVTTKHDLCMSVRKETELRLIEMKKRVEIQERMLKLLTENPAIEEFMDLSRGIIK